MKKLPVDQTVDARITYLDGVRGWAAFIVLLYHGTAVQFSAIDPIYSYRLAWVLTDGGLAVYIFFVLSGFALSIHFLETGDLKIVRALALRRYLRLAIPIFCASFLSYLLAVCDLLFHKEAAALLSAPILGKMLEFTPSLFGLLKFSFVDVFFNYRIPESYGPALWTMPLELFGSFIVFVMLLLYPNKTAGRIVVYCGFLFVYLYMNPVYSCFLYGVLLAHLARFDVIQRLRTTFAGNALGVAMIISAGLFSAYGRDFYNGYWMPVGGVLVVAGPVLSARAAAFFNLRVSQFMGSISFPLYLTHYLVIASFSSWLGLTLSARGVDSLLMTRIVAAATIFACILVAVPFRVVENFAIRLSRMFSDWSSRVA